jgi:hypothetical protein
MGTFSKTGSQPVAGQTSSAGSTYASPSTGCQSADQNLTATMGSVWTLHFVNGGTGPTIGCSAQIDISYDGTAWRQYGGIITAPTTNSAVLDVAVEIPPPVLHTRVTFFGNTGQAVTVSAEIENITGFA